MVSVLAFYSDDLSSNSARNVRYHMAEIGERFYKVGPVIQEKCKAQISDKRSADLNRKFCLSKRFDVGRAKETQKNIV